MSDDPTGMPPASALDGDPGWRRLLAAARRSLERTGGQLAGSISLAIPTEAERHVVIGVTGVHRSAAADRLTVRLDDLDQHLRSTHGVGLSDLLAQSAPLRNRPGESRRESEARDGLVAAASRGRHADSYWYRQWLDGLRRDGTLTRAVRSGLPFVQALQVLDALPTAEEPMPAFAERVLGDTKALREGVIRGLVLRAIAAWQLLPPPDGSEQERSLWESVGVVPDDLASQVLVLNLPGRGGLLGPWLTQAATVGMPVRVHLYQLRQEPLEITVDELFVCENPAVVRACAGRGTAPLVCTEGVPSAAVHALLRAAPGAVLHWRSDFDWAGARITGNALRRYANARPWRMAAADYLPHAGAGIALAGPPVPTPWDPSLSEAMVDNGRAVMEERLLDPLLGDLRR